MTEVFIILLLILLNGLLAMSEIALISVKKSQITAQVKNGSKNAKTILNLIEDPDKFLSTIQIGITVIGILTGIYSGSTIADKLSNLLTNIGISSSISHSIAQTIIVIIVTYFTLILGELVPKRIGMSSPSTVSKLVAKPMYLLSKIAAPFVWILARSTTGIVNLLNLKRDSNKITEQEIKSMIEEGSIEGEVQEVEQDIVERVFLLGDLKVNSLMTHRKEIITLDINMNMMQIREIITKNLHEFYPVVDRNIDNLKGIVSLKDIVLNIDDTNFKMNNIVNKATYFHEGMSVYNALEKMKLQHIKVALIYDEFGSCQGIISLKDILEGLVGDCDNTIAHPQIIERADKKSWLVDAKYPLHNFLSYFNREELYPNNADFSTLGGLILDLLEYIPKCGERLDWNEFTFEILDLDGARIDKVLVLKNGQNKEH